MRNYIISMRKVYFANGWSRSSSGLDRRWRVADATIGLCGLTVAPTSAEQPRAQLGLLATGALVVGGIIGIGIFTVPAAVAKFGWMAYPAFAVVTVGSLLLALTFAALARDDPRNGGPAYVYAQQAFGPFTGFLSAWSYWIQGWTGQATISVAGAGYLIALLGVGGSGWVLAMSLVFVWLPAVVNVVRPGAVGGFQVITTILKLVPLIAIGVAGIVLLDPGNIGRPHSTGTALGALGPACAVLLFSFLGMEGAAVAAGRVRNAARTIPRATVLGVLVCAGVYLIGLLGVQGSVPQSTLMTSSAPFAAAAQAITGAHWPAHVIEVVACISALGALNGWTMVNGEMAEAAARDRLFPDAVGRRDARGIPVLAIVLNTVLATLLLIVNAAGNVVDLFTTLALLSTFVYVLTYVLAVAAFLMRVIRGQTTQTGRPLAVETLAAGLALAFSIWMIGATGQHTVFDGVLLVLIGIPVYLADQWRRARAGTAEPTPAGPPAEAPSAAAREGV
jgi:APA family basic amino acid/polyamine antiporter